MVPDSVNTTSEESDTEFVKCKPKKHKQIKKQVKKESSSDENSEDNESDTRVVKVKASKHKKKKSKDKCQHEDSSDSSVCVSIEYIETDDDSSSQKSITNRCFVNTKSPNLKT